MSQMRLNPLNGRWVTIVAERAERPSDFAPRVQSIEDDPGRPCPFCPGNEEATPPALETVEADGSWSMRVIPNRYPAFDGAEAFARRVGAWVGPLVGAATILVMTARAGRRSTRPVTQGAAVGLVLAGMDVAILAAAGEAFAPLFLASNTGKVLAGAGGGSWSRRGSNRDLPRDR